MDVEYVRGRVEHEGLSFLTITLPRFGKDFEKSLDQGKVTRNLFQGFTWKAGLPRFLGGFLESVFDRNTGVLLENPNIDAILSIRQLTLMFGKILVPCSEERVRGAIEGYLECEQDVRETDRSLSNSDRHLFRSVSSALFRDLFLQLDQEVFDRTVVPKHGPGATADKLRGNSKYRLRTWTTRLEEIFPSGEFLAANSSFVDELDVDILEPGAEIPVEVIAVPKTLKTPRIIAKEPTHMQYMQGGLQLLIYDRVQRSDTLRPMIGFLDQTPNQRLAKKGSRTGNLATLDLSEASDRVSNQIVREMLSNYPHLHWAVDACRSRKADLTQFDKGIIRLAKFASMGSALTFPIEAMVFLTCCFIAISQELNTPVDDDLIRRFRHRVRIFGDDIIVPKEYVHRVVDVLEHFGAKVNVDKSFWTGRFRESCGKEFFDGEDVSIVRFRREFPAHLGHAAEVTSLVAFRNQLYFAGYWATCKWLDEYIRDLLRYFPVVLPSSPALGRHSFLGYETQKLSRNTFTPLVKAYRRFEDPPSDVLDGHGALLKFFLKRGESPSFDERHLERAGRPRTVSIKPRWVPAV
nr:MAG: RNA-dependent RNA polymerase [Leviviridae sp.]